jgi:SMODS-associating 4TM effector domain
MNNIPQEQNTQQSLELLAAQRQLYSDAKSLQMVSVIMSVPVVIVWSVLVALFPPFAVYAALWGITATFLELLFFSRLQKSTQEKAAKIQQIFDCEVLQFNWASLNCGVRIEPETIVDASNRYKRQKRNLTKLQNWYPVSVSKLPIYQARIICQRSNVWWDAQLRRRYSKWIVFVLFILTIIVLLIGLIGGLTLEKFLLAVLAPLTPAFVFGLRQYTEHNDAAVRLDRLRENAEALVQEIINGRYTPQDLERESYSLQTQIFDNRRRSPLILDWLYSRLRNEDEEKMNKGAESLVQELIQNP